MANLRIFLCSFFSFRHGREKELCIHLDLQTNYHDGKMIAIIENKNANANYILNIFMDYCLKNNVGICLVSFLNPISHYQHCGVKLGHNLKNAQENGRAHIIDVLSNIRNQLIDPILPHMLLGTDLIKWLAKNISSSLEELLNQYERAFLIIDDLNVLHSLDIDEKNVKKFLHYLQILVSSPSKIRYV
jgi:hypothetical protein